MRSAVTGAILLSVTVMDASRAKSQALCSTIGSDAFYIKTVSLHRGGDSLRLLDQLRLIVARQGSASLGRAIARRGSAPASMGALAGAPVVTVWEPDSAPETLAVAPADPYAAQAAYFLDRLDDHAPIDEGSPAQARSAVAVAAATVRSARNGRPEPI